MNPLGLFAGPIFDKCAFTNIGVSVAFFLGPLLLTSILFSTKIPNKNYLFLILKTSAISLSITFTVVVLYFGIKDIVANDDCYFQTGVPVGLFILVWASSGLIVLSNIVLDIFKKSTDKIFKYSLIALVVLYLIIFSPLFLIFS